jgi:hypothetical protein
MPITDLDALKQLRLVRQGYSQDAAATAVMSERLDIYAKSQLSQQAPFSAPISTSRPSFGGTSAVPAAPNSPIPTRVGTSADFQISAVKKIPSAYTATYNREIKEVPALITKTSQPSSDAPKTPKAPTVEVPTSPEMKAAQNVFFQVGQNLPKTERQQIQQELEEGERNRMVGKYENFQQALDAQNQVGPTRRDLVRMNNQVQEQLRIKAENAEIVKFKKELNTARYNLDSTEIAKIRSQVKLIPAEPLKVLSKDWLEANNILVEGGLVDQYLTKLSDVTKEGGKLKAQESSFLLQKIKPLITPESFEILQSAYTDAVTEWAAKQIVPKLISGYNASDPKAGEKLKQILNFNQSKDRPFGFIPQMLGMSDEEFALSATLPKFSKTVQTNNGGYADSENDFTRNFLSIVKAKKDQYVLDIEQELPYNRDLYNLGMTLTASVLKEVRKYNLDTENQLYKIEDKLIDALVKVKQGKMSKEEYSKLSEEQDKAMRSVRRLDENFEKILTDLVSPEAKAQQGHVRFESIERDRKTHVERQTEYDNSSTLGTLSIGLKRLATSFGNFGDRVAFQMDKAKTYFVPGAEQQLRYYYGAKLVDSYFLSKKYPIIDYVASAQAGKPISASQFAYFDKEGGFHLGSGFLLEGPGILAQMVPTIKATSGAMKLGGYIIAARASKYASMAESAIGAARAERYAQAVAKATNSANKVSYSQVWRNYIQSSAAAANGGVAKAAISLLESKVPTFLATYATVFPGIYRQTLNDLYDRQVDNAETTAFKLASVSTLIEAITEGFMPDVDYLTGGTANMLKGSGLGLERIMNATSLGGFKARMELLKMLPISGKNASMLAKIGYMGSRGAQEILKYGKVVTKLGISPGEGLEEVTAEVGNYLAELAFVDQTRREPEDIDAESLVNAFVGGAFLTGPVGVAGLFKGGIKQVVPNFASYYKEGELQTAFRMAVNPEIYQAEIQRQLDRGRIDEQTAAKALLQVKKYNEIAKSKEFTNIRNMNTFLEDRDEQYLYFRAMMNSEGIQKDLQEHGDKLSENERKLLLETAKEAQKDINRYKKKGHLYENMTEQEKEDKMIQWVNERTKGAESLPYAEIVRLRNAQLREKSIARINQNATFPRIGKVMDSFIRRMDDEILSRNKAIIEARENGQLNPLLAHAFTEIDSENPNSKEVRPIQAENLEEVEAALLQTLANPDTQGFLPEFYQNLNEISSEEQVGEEIVNAFLKEKAEARGVKSITENDLTDIELEELIEIKSGHLEKLEAIKARHNEMLTSIMKSIAPSMQLNMFTQQDIQDLLFGNRSKLFYRNGQFVVQNYDAFSHEGRVNLSAFHAWFQSTAQQRAEFFNEQEQIEQEEERKQIEQQVREEQRQKAAEAQMAAEAETAKRTTAEGNLELFTQLTDLPAELFDQLKGELTDVEFHNLVGKILQEYVVADNKEQFNLRLKYLLSLIDPENSEAFIAELNNILAASPIDIGTKTSLQEISPVLGLKFTHLLDSDLAPFAATPEVAEAPAVETTEEPPQAPADIITVQELEEEKQEEEAPIAQVQVVEEPVAEPTPIPKSATYVITVNTPDYKDPKSIDHAYAKRQAEMFRTIDKSKSSYGVRVLDFHTFFTSYFGQEKFNRYKALYERAKTELAQLTGTDRENLINQLRAEFDEIMPKELLPSQLNYIFDKFIVGDITGLKAEKNTNPTSKEIYSQHKGKAHKGGIITGFHEPSNSVTVEFTVNGAKKVKLVEPSEISYTTYSYPAQTFKGINFLMYAITNTDKEGNYTSKLARFDEAGAPNKDGGFAMIGSFLRDPKYTGSIVADQLRQVIESQGSLDAYTNIIEAHSGTYSLGFSIGAVEVAPAAPKPMESKVEEAQVPTAPAPVSTDAKADIEAKKADIERRRQEELNVFPNSEVEEIVYHNTTTDFEEFKQGKDGAIHFGDKEAARQRTKNVFGEKFTKEAKINIKNLVEGVDSLDFDAPVNATKEEKQIYFELLKKADNETKEHIIALYKNGKVTLEQANKLIDENWSLEKIYKELFNADGYYYINQAENKGSKSYVVFNPNQIKIVNKINAKYDAELAALESSVISENTKKEGTNKRGSTYKAETKEKEGIKTTKYIETNKQGKKITLGGRVMAPEDFIAEYSVTNEDDLDNLEGATEVVVQEVRTNKEGKQRITIRVSFGQERMKMEVRGLESSAPQVEETPAISAQPSKESNKEASAPKTGIFLNKTAHEYVGAGFNLFGKSVPMFLPQFITRNPGTEKNVEQTDEYVELTENQANQIYDNLVNAANESKGSATAFVDRIREIKSFLETVNTPKANELLRKLNELLPAFEEKITKLEKDLEAYHAEKKAKGEADVNLVWEQRKQFQDLDLSGLQIDNLFEAVEIPSLPSAPLQIQEAVVIESAPVIPTTIHSTFLEESKAIVEQLIQRSAAMPEPSGGVYEIDGELYMRQSEFNEVAETDEDPDTTNKLKQNGATVGDYVDALGRDIIQGNMRTGEPTQVIEQYQNEVAAKQNPGGSNRLFVPLSVPSEVHTTLVHQFQAFKNEIESQGGKVYTEKIVLFRKFKEPRTNKAGKTVVGVAGVIDILVVDAQGNIHIVDMKNFSSGSVTSTAAGISVNPARAKEDFYKSFRAPKWTKQQSTYAVLAKGLLPKVKSISIYGVAASYFEKEVEGKQVLSILALSRIDSLSPNPNVPLVTRLNNNEGFKRSLEPMFEARKDITFEKEINDLNSQETTTNPCK